jgi:tRNA modification GTPase
MHMTDTIAAISTTVAPAARIIVRMSGPQSHSIASAISIFKSEIPGSSSVAARTELSFNNLNFPAWVYSFRGPHSYTGEDSIEFHLPGSPVLAKMLVDELYRSGIRPAEPGEFTARAFFNGKIGLTEAEGVAATIAAGNEAELAAARQLLAGELARRLWSITESLAQTLALIEVGIDFSEEDVTFLAAEEVAERIQDADAALDDLLNASGRFEQLTHEPRIVFAGRPNAGKSSLINALTKQQRAIVSDVAGTTRDVLSAPLNLPRGRVLVADVAGLDSEPERAAPISSEEGGCKKGVITDLPKGVINFEERAENQMTKDSLQKISDNPFYGAAGNPQDQINCSMQHHAQHAIEAADHVVLVRDCTDDRPPLEFSRVPSLNVLTKSDLVNDARHEYPGLKVSAKTGAGLDTLRDALDQLAFGSNQTGTTLALNRRHLLAIETAREALSRAAAQVIAGFSELVAMDLRDVLDALGSVVGEVTPDDVLGRVFTAFCIGK